MFRHDAPLNDAIYIFTNLVKSGEDIAANSHLSHPNPLGRYTDWIYECEKQMRWLFTGQEHVNALFSRRFWHLVESEVQRQPNEPMEFFYDRASREGAKVGKLVKIETEIQVGRLKEIISMCDDLRHIRDREGLLAVPDTNVLLHYQKIDLIDWHAVLKHSGPIRLVIPILVLDELDDKRYTGSVNVRKAARTAIQPLDDRQADLEATGVAPLRDNTSVEYLLSGGDSKRGNPDSDILGQAELLQYAAGRPVTVVTGDRNMRQRAVVRGLRVVTVPSRYARAEDEQRGDVYNA
ncbi:PIN domain-containing protein [Streptomyces canus]|uniref:PIN domain-containing protein n=1 Tax=Streptomyces canus TaxID=58343 RepID=UPI003CF5E7B0